MDNNLTAMKVAASQVGKDITAGIQSLKVLLKGFKNRGRMRLHSKQKLADKDLDRSEDKSLRSVENAEKKSRKRVQRFTRQSERGQKTINRELARFQRKELQLQESDKNKLKRLEKELTRTKTKAQKYQ